MDRGERSDPHATISPTEARERGCTCEFGCRSCGRPLAMMDACAAWTPCHNDAMKIGRAADPNCPLMAPGVVLPGEESS